MEVTDIKATIKTRIATVLGSPWSELPHAIDITKNSFKGNAKGYGVIAGGILQEETFGVLGSYSVNQTFTIKLTDSFSTKPADDSARQTVMDDLMDKSLDIYKDLINTRAGSPASVIHVTDLDVGEVEELVGSNVMSLTMTFIVKYRKGL